ncbi:MAG: heavy metal translocating P-type ATPase [Cyanobacteria bacterium HKST-UBA04]|nr:heavy metal translocating P-type ATPase [Cyanobacteria bacterium HKST-UBA04]
MKHFKHFKHFSQWPEWITGVCMASLVAYVVLRAWGLSAAVGGWSLPLLLAIGLGIGPVTWSVLYQIRRREFGADVLALVAMLTSLLLGELLACTLIILMMAGGRTLEQFALRKASGVLAALAKRMPHIAHRKLGEQVEDVSVDTVNIGDHLLVFPHETAPVDGTVIDGYGTMDESFLTGEPYHVDKAPGAAVLSGAVNGESVLAIRADKQAVDSRFAQIVRVMQDAELKRPAMRRLGDQVGAWFTPLALATALLTWALTGSALRFLAVLVVATPCPLLIAVPITIISAISLAAKRGIIIRDPVVLERLPTCRTAIFDKTGTLTYGRPTLTDVVPAPAFDNATLLRAAASLERYSKHPLASAILEAARHHGLVVPTATSVSEKPGQGLSGLVDTCRWHLTSRNKLARHWPQQVAQLPPTQAGLECVLLRDECYAGLFRFRDVPRAEGHSFIDHLGPAHLFGKVMIVSGDRAPEVAYLAKLLGIEVTLAEQSPEQKLAIVRAETAVAPTMYMGDGINDAPALAAATVGVAFGQHSNITSEAAGAVILDNTLVKVDELLHISFLLRQTALQCAVGGMLLSLVAMGLAAFGYLSPVQGALVQEGIDLLAVLNALRLAWQPQVFTDMPAVPTVPTVPTAE